jgi:fibronectin-binding autotransporter adhesin
MSIVDNGTLRFVRQDYNVAGIAGVISGSGSVIEDVNNSNPGNVTFSNNMTYTGGTVIAGGGIILGDGVTPGLGMIVGNVMFTNSGVSDDNKSIEFNRPDNVTFAGVISGSGSTVGGNQGQLIQAGPGNVTLTGNSTYVGSTIISNCVLQVGIGGTTGAIGSTNIVTDWGTLIFDRSDSVTLLGGINGSGLVSQAGSGTLTLAGNLAMTSTVIVTNGDSTTTTNVSVGSIAANNGTLVLNPPNGNVANNLTVSGGTLVAGGVSSVSTLNVFGTLNISSGTVVAALNKSLAVSNTTFVVSNAVTRTGGSLQLVNYGPALAVGDKFTIFNKAVTGGAGMTIVSTGFTVNNNLAGDGSVTVATVVAATPPTLTNSVSGGNYNLSWPSGTGLNLYAQTNTLSAGLKSNWVLIPGYSSASSFSAPVNTASNTAVFYRLAP